MTSKDYHVKSLLSFAVLITIWLQGETINVHNACSTRADGVCEKCDGIPQCYDLSDEIGCPDSAINMEAFKQRASKCTRDNCAGGFPGPPPLPPFSLCSHVQTPPPTPRTTTNSPTETSIEEAIYYVTTQPTESTHRESTTQIPSLLTRTEAMSRPTTTTRKTQSTPTPALSSTQWLSTTTVKHVPDFMTVWWTCCTIYYRIEETVLCVNRYYWCLRTGTCLQPLRIAHTTIRPFFTFNNNVISKNRDIVITTPKYRSNEFRTQIESQTHTAILLNPETEKTSFYKTNSNLPPSSPKLPPRDHGRKQGISSDKLHGFSQQLIARSPKVRLPYETTTVPVTAATPSLQEPFYNGGLIDNDLMYALMVLGQF